MDVCSVIAIRAACVSAGIPVADIEWKPSAPPKVDRWADGFETFCGAVFGMVALVVLLGIGYGVSVGIRNSQAREFSEYMGNCLKSFNQGQCDILYQSRVDSENAQAMSAAALGFSAAAVASSGSRR